MRKTSHSHHHTLTEINITPLLDLAFVLLVIFIITTTPIVNDLDVELPPAALKEKDPPRKAHFVTLDAQGRLHLNRLALNPGELQAAVAALREDDPELTVILRADARTKYDRVAYVLDQLQKANVLSVDLATEAIQPSRQGP
jgi:biopolymer transport protein ExbD